MRPWWVRSVAACLVGPVVWLPVAAYATGAPGEVVEPELADEEIGTLEAIGDEPVGPTIDPSLAEGLLDHAGPPVDPTKPIYSVPGGAADKSAATPQAISLPKAEGSITGMGESFSPVLSSGTATFSVPLPLPPGRAGFTPSLSLSYSSSGGSSEVGFGWTLGVPFISRQTDRGLPRYVDGAAWHPQEDRFIYNGGQELVPVSTSAAELVDCGSAGCAPVPSELAGWQQYRARVEGGYQRFFRSPDSMRWVVQTKDGSRLDFGLLPVGDGPAEMEWASTAAVQSELTGGEGRVFKWFLTRATDPHGSTAYYSYFEDQGARYLEDIHYVSPHSTCGALSTPLARMRCTAALEDYGRRVHLVYEPRPDVIESFMSGWSVSLAQRVKRIEMTGATNGPGTRKLARRYHLMYDATSFHSLLASVQLEGRPSLTMPATGVVVGRDDIDELDLGDAIIGDTLPPMRFTYTEQPTGSASIPGFGGIDATVAEAGVSPPHSVDELRADLFDANSDGLPDLIVTNPALYTTEDGAPGVGVFFNGFDGPDATPSYGGGTFSDAVVMPVPDGYAGVMTLSNASVVPMDIDGDGRSDLLHMPRVANYGYFSAVRDVPPTEDQPVSPAEQGWRWAYVPRALPDGAIDPGIDFTATAETIRQFDVNNDSLIDVVQTTGTSIKTWFNLGWLPDGDGRFGSFAFDAATATWVLSPTPVARCLPVAGTPIDFGNSEIRLADLNGDGLQDIVRLRAGSLVYWPGRGDGSWGVGEAGCAAGFAGDREITVSSPPGPLNPELEGVHFADVNGDGADDLIQVRFMSLDVWFNEAGHSFTSRIIASGTPHAPSFANRVRVTDIDGSGTIDVLYARADDWRWIDLMGGQKPRLLSSVMGSLGAVTELQYASSTEDYLADLRDAEECLASGCQRFTWSHLPEAAGCDGKFDGCVYRAGATPVVSTVVRTVSTSDRFHLVGSSQPENVVVNAYAYHDGYYDGIEREFRGFGAADVEAIGDANSPTSYNRTYFHQARRPWNTGSDRLVDSVDEPLKGQVYLTEVFDADDRWLSTSHRTLKIRTLHAGQDGRAVRDAIEARADVWSYDHGDFEPMPTAVPVPRVIRGTTVEEGDVIRREAADWAQVCSTVDDVDNVGNPRQATKLGRVRGEFGETIPDESIVSHATPINVSCGLTGWQWRTEASYVDGHALPDRLGDTTNVYNCTGDLIESTVDVTQPQLYNFGPTLGTPTPEDIEVSTAYDPWGNGTATCAGGDVATGTRCLRYGTIAYDASYAMFAVTEDIAVARGTSGWQTLTTAAEWDTGLGLLLEVTDPNDEVSGVSYDGFGRLTSLTPPPVTGCSGGMPAVRLTYLLATSPSTMPLSRVHSSTFTSCTSVSTVIEAYSFIDGLGRVRAVLSEGEGTAGREWVQSGVMKFDARGAVARAFQPAFHSPAPSALAAAVTPTGYFTRTSYDPFGRVATVIAEDGSYVVSNLYHALSKEVSDHHDIVGFNTPTIERLDGHGRTIEQILINTQPGALPGDHEYYRLWSWYRADGALVDIARMETVDATGTRLAVTAVPSPNVKRHFFYDSVGRRVGATDPDTDNRDTGDTWRYLFNRVGDLAAVRDPRNCGQDFFYDHGGRLIGEAYVPCSEAQPHETPIEEVDAGSVHWTETPAARAVDVRHWYDSYAGAWETLPSTFEDYPGSTGGLLGRLAATSDRGQRSVIAYDRRGNAIWKARQMALIPEEGTVPATLSNVLPDTPAFETPAASTYAQTFDELRTYVVTRGFDHGGRGTALVLPRDPDFGGPAPHIAGTLTFTPRGLPNTASAHIVASGGTPTISDGVLSWATGATTTTQVIISEVVHDADGQVSKTTYGDTFGAGGARQPTVSETDYDTRRRPSRVWTDREPTPYPVPPDPLDLRPLGAVTRPFDQTLDWDEVNNLTGIEDGRYPLEWAPGHRPQSVTIRHDDLYRVVEAEYQYHQDDGSWSWFDDATDWRAEETRIQPSDPMRRKAAPMVPSLPDDRVASLLWEYDWLGNMTLWDDDAHAFYERSIGSILNGADGAPTDRPSALYLASDLNGTSTNRGGYVTLEYGDGGNVIGMTVRAQCMDVCGETCTDPGGSNASRRLHLATSCFCQSEQHYQYVWDEANRLAEGRRYDRDEPIPEDLPPLDPSCAETANQDSWSLNVRQRARYDAANQRTVKHIIEAVPGDDPADRLALWPFPGDLERRGLTLGAGTYTANTALDTETQYLVAGARIVWQSGTPATTLDAGHRLTIAISDLLGTTSAVIDLRTGELVESSTYYPNGARETLRALDAPVPVEPMGFTAKEADDEVGLVYFGERYLISRLARWACADPLAIHAMGGGDILNSYHYVGGNLLQARDPVGLGFIQGETGERQAEKMAADAEANYDPDELSVQEQLQIAWEHGSTADRVEIGATLTGLAATAAPIYVSDYVSLGSSVVAFGAKPSVSNGIDVALDAVGAAAPVLPAAGTMRRAGKILKKFGKVIDAEKARRKAARTDKLRKALGDPPSHIMVPQAHHDLPWKFKEKFEAHKLDIDDPAFGRWVEAKPWVKGNHQSWSGKFNQEWQTFSKPRRISREKRY